MYELNWSSLITIIFSPSAHLPLKPSLILCKWHCTSWTLCVVKLKHNVLFKVHHLKTSLRDPSFIQSGRYIFSPCSQKSDHFTISVLIIIKYALKYTLYTPSQLIPLKLFSTKKSITLLYFVQVEPNFLILHCSQQMLNRNKIWFCYCTCSVLISAVVSLLF